MYTADLSGTAVYTADQPGKTIFWSVAKLINILSLKNELSQRRHLAIRRYPEVWSKIIAEWSSTGSEDCAWLMYSANYLLRCGGTRWAIDPFTLHSRLPAAPRMDAETDLRKLDFIVLTHAHIDHLELHLLRALRNLPIPWIVPEFLTQRVIDNTGIPESRIIIPQPFHPIILEGISLTPFPGLHWETPTAASVDDQPTTPKGAASMGYLAEFSGKRWLFPGDTRMYDASQIAEFGGVEGVFAHIWLGRGCALMEEPPLLEAFCRFFLDLGPRRIVITHLEEWGRRPEELWDARHGQMVVSKLLKLRPQVLATCAMTGNRINL